MKSGFSIYAAIGGGVLLLRGREGRGREGRGEIRGKKREKKGRGRELSTLYLTSGYRRDHVAPLECTKTYQLAG